MTEEVKTTRIYEKDLTLLKAWMEGKGIENSQEALRICIEFANAHEVFS
jgi:hypothetical protein